MSNHAIKAERLTKHFGNVLAVQSLDLRVRQGEIYGFLGLNGAGKTTTIRALLGMIRPGGGRISVLGQEVGPGGRGPWSRVGHLAHGTRRVPATSGRFVIGKESVQERQHVHLGHRLACINGRMAGSGACGRKAYRGGDPGGD